MHRPQNLVEFWAVATRPLKENGMGMSAARAADEIEALRQFFRVLPYSPEVLDRWQETVTRYGVSGRQTHDAHLVAVMQAHGVTEILTFNVSDFTRFSGITVLDPAQVQV